jgi:hypothetical protein
MTRLPLIIILMTVVAIIIVAMAFFVFTNFSSINITRSLVLIAAGVAGMLIIIGILWVIYKSNKTQK